MRLYAVVTSCALSLTLCVLSGCNLSGGETKTAPFTVVETGSWTLHPKASLGLKLDFRALLGDKYQLQALTPGDFHEIVAQVSGPLVTPIKQSVNVIDCPSGIATINFVDLPIGNIEVTVNALDIQGNVIAYGSGTATIVANQITSIPITCQKDKGSLTVNFDCPLCNVPANPIADGHLGMVTGFTVDVDGNAYIIGLDEDIDLKVAPATATQAPRMGRIVKVNTRRAIETPYTFDDMHFVTHGQTVGKRLYFREGIYGSSAYSQKRLVELDLNSAPATVVSQQIPPSTPTSYAFTADGMGAIYAGYTSGPTISFTPFGPTSFGSAAYSLSGPSFPTGKSYAPTNAASMSFNYSTNQPIWASSGGLITINSSGTAVNLSPNFANPATEATEYLVVAPIDVSGPNSSKFLVSLRGVGTSGSPAAGSGPYLFDSVSGTNVQFTGANGVNLCPLGWSVKRIQRGPNGYIYMMFMKNETSGNSNATKYFFLNRYTCDLTDPQNPKLVDPLEVAQNL